MWLTDGRQSLKLQGERIARVEPGARGLRLEAITPGLQDAHAHPLYWGVALRGLDLEGLAEPARVAERVAERVRRLPPGAWVEGQGFLFPAPPPPGLLDRAAPEHPVFLRSRDHHSAWINRKAAEVAGLGPASEPPSGGGFLRDGEGVPYYLLERAQELLLAVLPPPSPEDLRRGLRDFARRGYTAVHAMGYEPPEALDWALGMELPLRLWWALPRGAWRGREPGRYGEVHLAAVKFFADGALGSRTAWMHQPYPDGSFGLPLDPLEAIREEGEEALRAGFTLAVHAIGTRAVEGVLAVFRDLAPLARARGLTLRMEHVQHVRDAALPGFAGLPVALSLQPLHLLQDQHLVRAYGLSPREAFRFQSLKATGLPLAFGSDAPVAKPEYAQNLEAATRHPLAPEESLDPGEVLEAHTLGAARAAGWEDVGLRPGARADLTLWEGGRPVGRVYRGNLELF
ncbi:Amidohydrolase 3 [Thermus sp. CCB_US3_UF1]|uniref:amidohydrolase n=1 Tax=Thermus sp. CCB_US3_UF1 TaxID=1111069 RepID=UPI0002389795|nr:amidohydrolase [Thermus sp. CCB_US3_UF1]AEV15843.1 Amidohydrolase 3 [Thermus sp. CCB_US3_UF1]